MLSQVFNLLLRLLVVQHNVWLPYPVGRHPDKLNASKIFWIPSEFVVIPDLKNKSERLSYIKNKSGKLQCQTNLCDNTSKQF